MQIEFNGQPREIADGTTVAALVAELQLDPRYLAVERNRELVPRAEHASTLLAAGDRVEVVTLVGGG
ncbi:MAG: sulfur carrier protein ThiS [Planctomycetes bacterium]|nr:sulfur carrier protein ThiS [Planctomycetota bacterium]